MLTWKEATRLKSALYLSRSPERIKQLSETRRDGFPDALEYASYTYESVALQLIQRAEGRAQLAKLGKYDKPKLFAVLERFWLAASELIATPEGRLYLAKVREPEGIVPGWTGLHVVASHHTDLGVLLNKLDPELLVKTVSTGGWSAYDSVKNNIDQLSFNSASARRIKRR